MCSKTLNSVICFVTVILISSSAGSAQTFKVFGVSDLSQVFEDGYNLPVVYDTINIFGIRGEIISGQFIIISRKDLTNVSVEETPLFNDEKNVSIPLENLKWDFVGSVMLPVNAPNQPLDVVSRIAPAKFPDYLKSERHINIEKGKFQPVWLTIKIPDNAADGNYRSNITVSCLQGKQSVPVNLTVYPLTLTSERHLKIAVRYSVNGFDKYHGIEEIYSEKWFEMLEKYAENMVEHRQNVLQAPVNVIEIRISGNGMPEFDFTRFDQIVQVFMNTGKMDFIETGYGLTRFGDGDWFSPVIELSDFKVKNKGTGEIITLPGKDIVPYLLPAIERHLRQKGWLEKALLSVRNEPSLHNAENYRELSDYFHSLAPDLKQFESIETTEFGGLDIAGPKLDHLATWYDKFKEAQEKGTELCYYIVGIYQGSRYPDKTIDMPVIDSRIMPWLNYKYNLSGIKHWGWNSWTDDPYKEVGQHLGDGWHVYPVKDGLLNSLRWEEMRNGIQDYEYFRILEEKIRTLRDSLGSHFLWIDPRQRGIEIAGEAVKDFAEYTSDPVVLYKAKQKIINEILDFDKTPIVYVQTNPVEKSTLTSRSSVEVFGWTEPGTKIVINGKELSVNNQGLFLEQFTLSTKQNFIKVQADNSKGRKEITREFIVK